MAFGKHDELLARSELKLFQEFLMKCSFVQKC